MTSIQFLSLQGIRAFNPSPDAQHKRKQELKFLKPLTIILGANGAGKTTIIEALRNACTGELPPGTGTGSSFIHDPRMANETEVKAQIRMQFHSASRNAKMLVVRSFQVTQKKSQQSFKRLEVAVQYEKSDGTMASLAHKCGDMDKLIPEFLGVPKPILDGVIFCHQEDGNWPLGEPRMLKSRFDDIFAATRYTKALDEVRKCRKEKMKEVQELDKSSALLSEQKMQAEKMQNELNDSKSKLAIFQGQVEDINAKASQYRDQLAKVQEAQAGIQKLHDNLKAQEARIESEDQHCRELLTEIEYRHEEDDSMLLRMRDEFDEQIGSLTVQCQNDKLQIQEHETLVSRLNDQLLKVKGRRQVLEGEKKLYESKLQDVQAIVHRVCQQYQISLDLCGAASSGFVTGDGVLRFLQHFEGTIRDLEKEQQALKAEYRATLVREEEKISKQRQKVKYIEDEVKRKDDQVAKLMAAIQEDEREVARLSAADDMMKKAEQEMLALQMERERLTKEAGMDRFTANIQAKKEEVAQIATRLEELQTELQLREAEQQQAFALQAQKKDIVNKKAAMDEHYAVYEGRFLKVFQGRLVKLPFLSDHMKEAIRVKDELLAAENVRVQRATEELSAVRAEQQQIQRQLVALEADLTTKKRHLQGQLASKEPLSKVVKDTQKDVEKLQNKLTTTRALRNCYAEFIRQAEERHVCPTCSRGLTDAEMVKFVRDQQTKCDKAPKLIEETEAALMEKKKLNERFQELLKLEEQIIHVEQQILPLKRQLQECEGRHDEKEAELRKAKANRDKAKAEEQEARALAPEADNLKRMHDELQELETMVEREERKLKKPKRFGRSYEELQKEFLDVQGQRESKLNEIDDLRQAADAESAQVKATERRIADKQREVYHLKLELHQRQEKLRQMQEKEAEAERLRREIHEWQESIPAARVDLQKLEAAKEQIMKVQDSREQEVAVSISERNSEFQRVQIHAKEIRRFTEQQKLKELDTVIQEENEVAQHLGRRQQELSRLQGTFELANSRLQQQSTRKIQLQRNIQYRASKARLAACQAELQRMRNELREKTAHMWAEGPSGRGKDCFQFKDELTAKLNDCENSMAFLKGQEDQLRSRITNLERELRSPTYDRIFDRYKSEIIKLKTLDMACKDLEKYATALDKALMKYHSGKMAEINELIKELWQKTYRGQDIDYIEIKSDEEMVGETTRARSYNYRVVMVKGKVSLDMRGRCSAGQKVLASLVIRLALSEAFCCDCGVLALDEPTTNLDQDNIQSLAESLLNIIQSRRGQRNFQLIVITHDEDFVRHLGSSGVAEYFYYVSKDLEGQWSTITRKNFVEL